MYLLAGRPDKAQATVREALNVLWSDRPHGIPGNDDLGAMSSWYVWAALGLYPALPGRAELLVGSPLFPYTLIHRATGARIVIQAPEARSDAPFVRALRVDGKDWSKPWLPEVFMEDGGELVFDLSDEPDLSWGSAPKDAPPSLSGELMGPGV
jgi:putative alpha-1,2-mannosidase